MSSAALATLAIRLVLLTVPASLRARRFGTRGAPKRALPDSARVSLALVGANALLWIAVSLSGRPA